MIHNLIRRAPERRRGRDDAAQRLSAEIPDLFYQNNIKGWGRLCEAP
jgi:hypothetical protein